MSKFLAIDLHVGIRDMQDIFQKLGHTLDVWSISDHHFLMGWERKKVDYISQQTWRGITPEVCDVFYERYKEEFKQYDGFVCFYPPAFSLLYEKFNKPIIIQCPLRYETGIADGSRWNWLNDYLKRGIKNKNITMVTTNKYDHEYIKYFTGLEIDILPNLCAYTGAKYTGVKKEFFFHSKSRLLSTFIMNPYVVCKDDVKNHSWQDLADYKAIIHIPYSNTITSLFEQYTANIPLLFPTRDFLMSLWDNFKEENIMGELSWAKILGQFPGSPIPRANNVVPAPDPNSYNKREAVSYWTQFSDFYDNENMPYVELFDSFQDLKYKLSSLDFQSISDRMKEFNVGREKNIMNAWKTLLTSV